MSGREPKPERVGIGELRQNLSVYVKRVREEGRAYEVTERGEPVARLTPLEERPRSIIDQLIAEGRATPATESIDTLPPPLDAAVSIEPVRVRSLDAIHLATAWLLRGEIEAVICYDVRLAEAARSLGLLIVAPA